jgi:Ser/Thr protein kinase RdoA (MazF antagonist)
MPASDWTPETARAGARRVCVAAGLAAAEPQLLRLGNNAVFRIDDRYVLRLARPGTPPAALDREVAVARELERLDVPAVRLAHTRDEQPLRADELLATLWDYVPHDQSVPDYAAFGRLLQEFHQRSTDMRLALPRWDALGSARSRLDALEGRQSADDLALLRQWCRRIQAELPKLDFSLPSGVIHGQAEIGNVVMSNGRLIFIDFERMSAGPREWDLTDTAVSTLRFALPRSDYAAFVLGYGFDVLSWSGFPTLRRVWELRATTWLMQNKGRSAETDAEIEVRLQTWRAEDPERRWTPF